MLFNTPLFFFFFIIFFFFYGFVFLRKTPRVYFILISSLVFYGAWNWKFIPLLVFSAVADYFIAQAIGSATSSTQPSITSAALKRPPAIHSRVARTDSM